MLAPHLNLRSNNFNDKDDDIFADTLIKAIMHVFRGGNIASQVVNDIMKFTQIKRNSFATVRDYIVAFRKQISIVEAHGHKITPLYAFTYIIIELKDESRKMNFIREDFTKSKDLSNETFNEYYLALQTKSDEKSSDFGAASAARATRNNKKKKTPTKTETTATADNTSSSTGNKKKNADRRGAPP
jgi:hypothetical protein